MRWRRLLSAFVLLSLAVFVTSGLCSALCGCALPAEEAGHGCCDPAMLTALGIEACCGTQMAPAAPPVPAQSAPLPLLLQATTLPFETLSTPGLDPTVATGRLLDPSARRTPPDLRCLHCVLLI